jgi:hypothetical protein
MPIVPPPADGAREARADSRTAKARHQRRAFCFTGLMKTAAPDGSCHPRRHVDEPRKPAGSNHHGSLAGEKLTCPWFAMVHHNIIGSDLISDVVS